MFATLYLFLFSKILGLVPAFEWQTGRDTSAPVLVTSRVSMAFVTRLMRTSMIEELNQDYIRTARAKGIPEFKVVTRHALRNAVLPVVTYTHSHGGNGGHRLLCNRKSIWHSRNRQFIYNQYSEQGLYAYHGNYRVFAVFLVVCTLIVDILYVFVDRELSMTRREKMTNNAEQIPASLWEPLESGENIQIKLKTQPDLLQDGWRRLKQNKTAMLSMIVIVILVLGAIFIPFSGNTAIRNRI